MALRTIPATVEQAEAFRKRFAVAQDGTPDNVEKRQALQREYRDLVFRAGAILHADLEPSEEVSIALTHLQTALLFGGKAIFA